MNTTKLIKTLALAMIASAVLLISGCSADDPLVENAPQITDGTVAGKAYTIPVTINVSRQDYGTKATYNESTRKLEFSAGDKLFVKGSGDRATTLPPFHEYGSIAGTLDYVPETGKFSGSVTTNFEFEGTADELFKYMSTYFNMSSTIRATLLPAGYDNIGYLTVNRDAQHAYYDNVSVDYTKAFAGSKTAGIEQLSYEVSDVYNNGFALAPQNSILNFTVTDLTPDSGLPAVFSYLTSTVNHNVTTNASGQATFAIGVENGTDFKDCSLTIAGDPITLVSDSKTLASGKIYNVSRRCGDVIRYASECEDIRSGKWSRSYMLGDVKMRWNGIYSDNDVVYYNGKFGFKIINPSGFTFIAPVDYKFTRIKLTGCGAEWEGKELGNGWTHDSEARTLTWTGDPAIDVDFMTTQGYTSENPLCADCIKFFLKYDTSGPESTVGGKFTINGSGDQVYFAKGNLRYVSGTWSFFDHQYDCYSSYSANAWDKFGWVGESGNLASETPGKWGVSTSTTDDDYGKVSDEDLANDWINVPDIGFGWHTLSGGTSGEWDYLLNTRSASTVAGVENARFAKAQVNGVHGLILFPDSYTHPDGVANPVGINETGDAGWNGNSYNVADWTKMEEAGCVFLPTAGWRSGTTISGVGTRCEYWTTTHDTQPNSALYLNVVSGRMDTDAYSHRYTGRSVRLVQDAR